MKNTLFLVIFLFSIGVQAQQSINWKVKPVKLDIDKIVLNRDQAALKDLYAVKKGDYHGVINVKGKLVMPIEYKRVQIWSGSKLFSGLKDKVEYYFDRKGKSYTLAEAKETNKSANKARSNENVSGVVNKLNNKDHFILNSEGDAMIIIGSNGEPIDTLKYFRNSYQENDDIYKANGYFYILSRSKKYNGHVREATDQFIVIGKAWKKQGLYDYDLNELLPKENDQIQFSKFNNVFTAKNTETQVVKMMNYDLEIIKEGKLGLVNFRQDKVMFSEDGRVELLDLLSNESKVLPYKKYKSVKKSDLVIVSGDSLRGVYNMVSSREILAPAHKYIKISGNFIIGFEKRRGIQTYSIYDYDGNKLTELELRWYETTGDYIFLHGSSGTIILKDNGEIFDEGRSVKIGKNGFLGITEDQKSYYTPIDNFFNGNSSEFHFDWISKDSIKGGKNGGKLLAAKRDGKFGLISLNGKVIQDFVFDEILVERLVNYEVVAKYKGKLGILIVPFI